MRAAAGLSHTDGRPSEIHPSARNYLRESEKLVNQIVSPATEAPRGAVVVWLLMQGEFGEGGTVLGVFADRELAKGQFAHAATSMPFGIDGAKQDDDGSIHLSAGCDWLSLKPYPLTFRPELTEGGAA